MCEIIMAFLNYSGTTIAVTFLICLTFFILKSMTLCYEEKRQKRVLAHEENRELLKRLSTHKKLSEKSKKQLDLFLNKKGVLYKIWENKEELLEAEKEDLRELLIDITISQLVQQPLKDEEE